MRARRDVGSVGIATAIVGALSVASSLFGLLWGLASVGVVGLLLILASRPGVTMVTPNPSDVTLTPSGRDAVSL